MTTPKGDLPDWQTFTAPPILPASVVDQAASFTSQILQSVSPFRVWGIWVRMSVCTSGAYVAAVLEMKTEIQDGNGNVLLEVACHVVAANQITHAELTMPCPGFTPANSGGFYQVQLKTDPSAANVFYRGSGGIFYSQP
jgi:hypothetical protein